MPLPWSSTISQYIILQREKFQDNHISGLVFAPFLLPAGNWSTMGSNSFFKMYSQIWLPKATNFFNLWVWRYSEWQIFRMTLIDISGLTFEPFLLVTGAQWGENIFKLAHLWTKWIFKYLKKLSSMLCSSEKHKNFFWWLFWKKCQLFIMIEWFFQQIFWLWVYCGSFNVSEL